MRPVAVRDIESVDVLLVEDSPADEVLLREGFRDAGHDVALRREGSAEGALLALRHRGAARLLVVDLGLPCLDGLSFLAEVNGRSGMPVVVLTGQIDGDAADRCAALGVAAVFEKPALAQEYRALAGELYRRWLETAS